MSSSAFFIEAAAKTVMVLSCASAPVRGVAVAMTSATAVKNEDMRLSILALLCGAGRDRANAPRAVVRQDSFVGKQPIRKRRSGAKGALTARHGPRCNSSSIVLKRKGG